MIDQAVALVLSKGGERITGINGTTRDRVLGIVRDTVTQGMDQGDGIHEISRALEAALGDASAFDAVRSELIARTETMMAYNTAALSTYGEFGVERVQAIDGDGDPECAERDGQDFSLEEAATIEDHPNGTLDWVPFFANEQQQQSEPPPELDQRDIEQVAHDLVAQATAAEPAVTRDIIAIGEATGLNPNAVFFLDGKRLETLDAKLKKYPSTLRKVSGELKVNPEMTAREVGETMKDNLRYTFTASRETYDLEVRQGIRELEARGYTPLRASNYWAEPNGYAGLNTNWRTADGQLFEVQFHTQRGLETKEVLSHPLYEAQRLLEAGSPEWLDIEAQVAELWAVFRAENLGLGNMPWLNDIFPEVRGVVTAERSIQMAAEAT